MRAQGKFYDYYISQKTRYEERIKASGRKIVPVTELPKINGKRTETVELISEGHVHNMALRKMVKLFLACLWLEWRKAEGLPLTKPYAIEQLGHDSFISPEEMCDRESREGD
jgi:UDP-2,3-diacylglucosamine pyrophosphatase LpxH